tara:strand:- start:378 stop:554 length:177 start_codon:yes stop_codon:yes gene_type:complete
MTEEQKDMWKQAPTKEEWVAFGMVTSWATTLIYQNRVSEDQTTIDLVEAFLNREGEMK